MNIRSQRKWLLLIDFIRVHWGFQARHPLRVLRKLRVVYLSALRLWLGRLSLLLLLLVVVGCLVGQVLLLGDDGSAVHPVESYEERWIHLGHLGGLDELTFHVIEVSLLVIRDGPDVIKQSSELWRKDIRWKQFFGFDFVFVLHHLLESLLVGFVPPR